MNQALAQAGAEPRARQDETLAAINLGIKESLLEHARMGRGVVGSRDGVTTEMTPAEVFAMYGLDEFGRPVAAG